MPACHCRDHKSDFWDETGIMAFVTLVARGAPGLRPLHVAESDHQHAKRMWQSPIIVMSSVCGWLHKGWSGKL